MRAAHLRLGAAGEDAAARMFANLDCEVLLRDYRVPKGEIDLIVRDGLSLVFAEVKTRRAKTPERAAELKGQLRPNQKRRIYRAAFTYMREIGRPSVPYRFDYIEVIFLRSRLYAMRHWRAHFGVRSMKKPRPGVNLFRK
ncbi:MAG: YraN family protein [Lentisphaeria bacterium]|nr:YraN family protein [Lentisphaeria bacterium]